MFITSWNSVGKGQVIHILFWRSVQNLERDISVVLNRDFKRLVSVEAACRPIRDGCFPVSNILTIFEHTRYESISLDYKQCAKFLNFVFSTKSKNSVGTSQNYFINKNDQNWPVGRPVRSYKNLLVYVLRKAIKKTKKIGWNFEKLPEVPVN